MPFRFRWPGASRTLGLSWRRKSQAGKTRVYYPSTFKCAGSKFSPPPGPPTQSRDLFSSSRRNGTRWVRMGLARQHPWDVRSPHKLLSVPGPPSIKPLKQICTSGAGWRGTCREAPRPKNRTLVRRLEWGPFCGEKYMLVCWPGPRGLKENAGSQRRSPPREEHWAFVPDTHSQAGLGGRAPNPSRGAGLCELLAWRSRGPAFAFSLPP